MIASLAMSAEQLKSNSSLSADIVSVKLSLSSAFDIHLISQVCQFIIFLAGADPGFLNGAYTGAEGITSGEGVSSSSMGRVLEWRQCPLPRFFLTF